MRYIAITRVKMWQNFHSLYTVDSFSFISLSYSSLPTCKSVTRTHNKLELFVTFACSAEVLHAVPIESQMNCYCINFQKNRGDNKDWLKLYDGLLFTKPNNSWFWLLEWTNKMLSTVSGDMHSTAFGHGVSRLQRHGTTAHLVHSINQQPSLTPSCYLRWNQHCLRRGWGCDLTYHWHHDPCV